MQAHPTSIVVEVGGVGYAVAIPLSSFERLPRRGEPVTVLTYFHVREDGMELYGFMTEEERSLFRLLLGVSGIGPKIAVGILSGISPSRFIAAINEGSAPALATVPGIGRKKAERIILELRDKVDQLEAASGARAVSEHDRVLNDSILALVSLGYSQAEAQKLVQAAASRIGSAENAEALIREALKSR